MRIPVYQSGIDFGPQPEQISTRRQRRSNFEIAGILPHLLLWKNGLSIYLASLTYVMNELMVITHGERGERVCRMWLPAKADPLSLSRLLFRGAATVWCHSSLSIHGSTPTA